MLVNLTMKPVLLYREKDVNYEFCDHTYSLKEGAKPLRELPAYDKHLVKRIAKRVGEVDKIPVYKFDWEISSSFPNPQEGITYVVNGILYDAVQATGYRRLDDLVLPYQKVFDSARHEIGYVYLVHP